jgi:hypothetical protein
VAAYSHYLGATVIVQYRLGDIHLSATGVFVGDSGRSIFLEQHLEQHGKRNYFRWDIPYGNIHSIETVCATEGQAPAEGSGEPERPRVNAAAAGGGTSRTISPGILSLPRPPKTA